MPKVFVEWTFTDDYGNYEQNGDYTWYWFDTIEQAEAWVKYMKKQNGSYFHLFRVAEGNYDKYLHMQELYTKIEEIKVEIETLYKEIEVSNN